MRRLLMFLLLWLAAAPAAAQKSGGVLRVYAEDSPASMSIHEEATPIVVQYVMGVFNNLVMYDQHVAQNSLKTIVPELADSWSWSADGKDLTFKLHHAVKWHDGQPFTAADVKCTFDMLTGKGEAKLRVNPRKEWWQNVDSVTTNGDLKMKSGRNRDRNGICFRLTCSTAPRSRSPRAITFFR